MTATYDEFIASKAPFAQLDGFEPLPLNPMLKDFQAEVAAFHIRAGRSACFLDTGLGKTFIQLECARQWHEKTNSPVLILAPLAVAGQTVEQGEKFDIPAKVVRNADEVINGVNVCNYERLHLFDPTRFAGVVLDESSILKSFMGKTKRMLCESFAGTPYRLCCTATPAPNDHMEIGNHTEFLSVMQGTEMLSRWFINDTMNFGNYRLKGHAVAPFWSWVASWARCVSKPSDLGYSDEGYILPALNLHHDLVDYDLADDATDGRLFRVVEMNATSLHKEKRATAGLRADAVATRVLGNSEPWIVWCDTDYEADALRARIPEAIEVRGSDKLETKEERLMAFSGGRERVLITKPSIAGFGMNWQHCAHVAFTGLSYSYESFYQAIRRCWRFGQERPVSVYVAMAETEMPIWNTVNRKADLHDDMKDEMRKAMARASKSSRVKEAYSATHKGDLPSWL